MLFMVGLEQLDRPSREVLLTYMNCACGALAARVLVERAVRRLGRLGRRGTSGPRKLGRADLIDRELQRLSGLNDGDLCDLFWRRLSRMAGFRITKSPPSAAEKTVMAGTILRRAARSVKLDARRYANDAALESAVVQKTIFKTVEELQKQLDGMSAEQSEELGRMLRAEVDRLTQVDRSALREFLDLDRLANQAVSSAAKAALPTIAAQAAAGSLGFGPYLFLSLMLKAVASLVGVTFAFGTYATAASALALCLSPAFTVALIGLFGSAVYRAICQGAQDRMAQLVVLAGHQRPPGRG